MCDSGPQFIRIQLCLLYTFKSRPLSRHQVQYLGASTVVVRGPEDGFGRALIEDVFPGIAQAGLVLEAYFKVNLRLRVMRRRYQLIQGQFLVLGR